MAKLNANDHIEETVQRLADLYEAHHRKASPIQRIANRVTDALGRPASVVMILLLIIMWIIGNYVASRMGVRALEQFPFPDLAFFATVSALVVALLILTTQRHDEALAEERAQLTLQIAMLSERKTTKIIALLEEQRRDNPLLVSRVDAEAENMGQSVDPLTTLEKIKIARSESDES